MNSVISQIAIEVLENNPSTFVLIWGSLLKRVKGYLFLSTPLLRSRNFRSCLHFVSEVWNAVITFIVPFARLSGGPLCASNAVINCARFALIRASVLRRRKPSLFVVFKRFSAAAESLQQLQKRVGIVSNEDIVTIKVLGEVSNTRGGARDISY